MIPAPLMRVAEACGWYWSEFVALRFRLGGLRRLVDRWRPGAARREAQAMKENRHAVATAVDDRLVAWLADLRLRRDVVLSGFDERLTRMQPEPGEWLSDRLNTEVVLLANYGWAIWREQLLSEGRESLGLWGAFATGLGSGEAVEERLQGLFERVGCELVDLAFAAADEEVGRRAR